MQIGKSLCSKCAPDHFVLYSSLDSEPAHEHDFMDHRYNTRDSIVNQIIKEH